MDSLVLARMIARLLFSMASPSDEDTAEGLASSTGGSGRLACVVARAVAAGYND